MRTSEGIVAAVIVLNWNQYTITRECLKSIFASTDCVFHLIVVDNGSKDGSAEKLRQEFHQVDVLALNENHGFADGCNIGFKHAMSKFAATHLILVSNDTILDRRCLFELITAGITQPNVGLVVPKIYYYDKTDVIWYAGGIFSRFFGKGRHIGIGQKDQGQFEKPIEVTFANGCVFLLPVNIVQEIGYFDASFFSYGEDTDFSLRVTAARRRIIYCPKAKVWHRVAYSSRALGTHYLVNYLSLRNTILLKRKHPKSISLIGVAFTIVYESCRHLIRAIINWDLRTMPALFWSIWDGLSGRSRYL